MQRYRLLGLVLLAFLTASTSPVAQQILWHAVGKFDVRWIAGPVVFVGDLDGDGFEDLVSTGQQNGLTRSSVFLLSGRSGRLLRASAVPSGYWLLRLDRAGDWDGDGIGDYAVTRWASQFPTDPTLAEVRSGRDDSVLFQAAAGRYVYNYGGNHLLSDLDTDGDGRPDLIVSVDRETSQNGAFYVYANDGRLRYRLAVGCCNTNLGKVGDIDGDGCDDFGYAEAAIDGVRVASGRTGATLLEVRGDLPNDHLGLGGIAACGDVDGDGVPDFVVSGSGRYPNNGVVRVVSGRDGSALYTFRKAFPPYGSAFAFGEVIASGFDLDQDGVQDLVVGERQYDRRPGAPAW
ncbi:MAG: VCBS repeat-containing protein [Planctomycetota bacterium]